MNKYAKLCDNYIEFSSDDKECTILQRKWPVGLLIFLIFSPGFYFTFVRPVQEVDMFARFFVGGIYLLGLWCMGSYTKASFKGSLGLFKYESGFFIPLKHIEGPLGNIEYIELYAFKGRHRSGHPILYFHCQNKRYELSSGIFGTHPLEVLRFAILIGCAVKFSGSSKSIGLDKNDGYIKKENLKKYLENIKHNF